MQMRTNKELRSLTLGSEFEKFDALGHLKKLQTFITVIKLFSGHS